MTHLRVYSEKWLELRLASALTQAGFQNFHMSDPTKPGIPDRYVIGAGGLWIEVKQGKTMMSLSRGFDRQRTFMNYLQRGGDKPFICALWQSAPDYEYPRLFLEGWGVWTRRERYQIGDFTSVNGSPFAIDHPNAFMERLSEFAHTLR